MTHRSARSSSLAARAARLVEGGLAQAGVSDRRAARLGRELEGLQRTIAEWTGRERPSLLQRTAAPIAKRARYLASDLVSHRPSAPSRTQAGLWLGIAAALAAMAVWNGRKASDAERRHPPRGRFVVRDGVRLHYVEAGSGPAIVLLHGNGMSSEDWRLSGVFDILARSHRVIAFDRPGFGWSERPRDRSWSAMHQGAFLADALLELGVRRPVLVGHSFGAHIAQAIALDGRVEPAALVLLSGYYIPGPRLDAALLSPPAIPALGDLLRWTVSPVTTRLLAERLYRQLFGPAPVPARFRLGFSLEMAVRPWQIRAAAAESARLIPDAMALRHRVAELDLPVVLVSGTGDRVVDLHRQAQRLHREIPRSELHEIEGAGHMVHHLAPAQVARIISEATRRVEPQRSDRRAA